MITATDVNELDPNKKGKEYCLKNAKELHASNTSGIASNFYNQKAKWQLNRKYSRGEQPIDNAKRVLNRDRSINFDSLNWTVPKIMPKMFDIMVGIVSKMAIEIECSSIDPESIDRKIVEQYRKEAEILLAEEISKLEQSMGAQLRDPNNQYKNVEELNMDVEDGSFKLDVEIAFEQIVDSVFDYNKLRQLRPTLVKDVANCGMAILRHYVQANGLIKIRRVDPIFFASDFVQTKDFRDMNKAGEYMFISMSTLRQLAGNELSDAEYINIAENVKGKYGNPNFTNIGSNIASYINPSGSGYIFDPYIVCVLYAEWSTTNRYNHLLDKPNKAGNKKTIRIPHANYEPDNRNKPYHKATDYKVWYKCHWIIDTDNAFQYGPLEFPNVKANSLNESTSTFAVEALDIDNMITSTYTERVTALMDMIFLSFMQMQSFLAKAVPPGIYAEMFALSNISNGKGGNTFKPLDLIEKYAVTGNLVGNSMLPNGQMLQRVPIENLQGSDLSKIQFFWSQIIQNIDLIKQVIGLNDFTDASNPNPEQSVGGAKLAAMATQNSLLPLINTIDNVIEKTAEGVINRAQHLASEGHLEYLVNAIGKKKILALAATKDLSSAAMGVKIAPRMDDTERAYLEQNIQTSLAQRSTTGVGGIEIEDAIAIRRCKNVKAAEKMLIYRRKMREQQDMERSKAQQEQNAMVQQSSIKAQQESSMAIAAQELEIYAKKKEIDLNYRSQEIQLEKESKMDEIALKGDIDQETVVLQNQFKTEGGNQ